MKKYNYEDIMNFISESNILQRLFEECNDSLKILFTTLIADTLPYSANEPGKSGLYAKEMEKTSFRLSKNYQGRGRKIQNYCMYTLRPTSEKIIVDLRTDGVLINSEVLHLDNRGNCFNGGCEWHQFEVKKMAEIYEAVRLIKYIYQNAS